MRTTREAARTLLHDVASGAWLGLLVLGVGGRIAMRGVAVAQGQPPVLDAGGTLTVVVMGALAGGAGALLYTLSRAASTWLVGANAAGHPARSGGGAWVRPVRLALFAALLALVTARGLRGSPGPLWPFWLLAATYGALLELALVRHARRRAPPSAAASGAANLTSAPRAG